MTRAEFADVLQGLGRAGPRDQDAGGPALALDLLPGRRRGSTRCSTSASRCAPTLAERYSLDRPASGGRAGVGRRHPQMADPHALDRPARSWRRDRMRLHPESDRGTLCVSSQVGCTLTCTFCHTGTQKLVRNLSSREIVAAAPRRARPGSATSRASRRRQDGLVPSGEGVRGRVQHRLHGHGRAALQSRRRPRRDRGPVGRRRPVDCRVAASRCRPPASCRRSRRSGAMSARCWPSRCMPSATTLRDELVPLNRKYPIAEPARRLPDLSRASSNARRITFEYVMLKGVNDSPRGRAGAGAVAEGHPGQDQPDPVQSLARHPLRLFRLVDDRGLSDIVFKAGYASPVRTPRGRDILAACGQLKSETEKAARPGPADARHRRRRAPDRVQLTRGIGRRSVGIFRFGWFLRSSRLEGTWRGAEDDPCRVSKQKSGSTTPAWMLLSTLPGLFRPPSFFGFDPLSDRPNAQEGRHARVFLRQSPQRIVPHFHLGLHPDPMRSGFEGSKTELDGLQRH